MPGEGKIVIRSKSLDEPLSFASAKAALAYCERQQVAWEKWRACTRDLAPPFAYTNSAADMLANSWHGLAGQAQLLAAGQDSTLVMALTDALERRRVVDGDSQFGAFILSLAETSPFASLLVASTACSDRIGDAFQNANGNELRNFWSAFLGVLPSIVGNVHSRTFSKHAREANLAAQDARDSAAANAEAAEKMVAAGTLRFDTLCDRGIVAMARATRVARKDASTELQAIREQWATMKLAFARKMQTRAPYTYWRQKQINHRIVARAWMRTFVWTLVLGFFGTGVGAVALLAIGPQKEPWPWLLPAICLGVPAFITLWIARLSNRQFTANTLRAEDAAERAVMVRTLLAMSEKNARTAGDAEFLTMISALFRPGPGFATEDSPAVGALDALLKGLQGKGDSR